MKIGEYYKTNEHFMIEIAAPGYHKEDFIIELENETLNVQADQNEVENSDQRYTLREYNLTYFKRSFQLPKTVDTDKIEAQYTDGILRLTIPKKEDAKKKPVRTIHIS
ncbi:Hsp20/alpha crystallin family protein [Cytophagaceae bacterium ABcell3]|nr:Hsp20/alpha crystallin family protein [Cytophagaceae bacterium ABcell3]